VFDLCLQRGMRLPFILCAGSSNGSVLCIRAYCDGSKPADALAEHYEGGGFRLPFFCMVLDQTGDAVHIRIDVDGFKVSH
jgi:hypothetical protein